MSPRVELRAGDVELDLEPQVGGSICAFRYRALPVLRNAPADYGDVLQASAFPLVPFCNRVRDGRFSFRGRQVQMKPNMPGQKHPLHGQGWRSPWRVLEATTTHAYLVFDHAPGDWPWSYQSIQRFHLDPNGFDYALSVRNTSDEAMPAGLGLHPYFPSGPDTVLDARVTAVWTIDAEIMPVERVPPTGRYDLHERRIDKADLDNGYDGWGGRADIAWPDRDLKASFTSPNAGRFQVYSPAEGGLFVAEPVTNANDALSRPESEWASLGISVLEPGAQTELTVRFDVSEAV